MAYLNHNIPPFSAYIRNEYLYNHTKGHGDFTFADLHTVNCMDRRALLFECLLPNGVNWTRRPINAFVWKKDYEGEPSLEELELWDCFSYDISVIEKTLLKGQRARYYSPSKQWYDGVYMFTIDSANADPNRLNTTFSEVPTQHKSFNIIKLNNGYFAAQPNNRMLILDKSYTPKKLKFPDFKVSSREYTVEDKVKETFGDEEEFMYGVDEYNENNRNTKNDPFKGTSIEGKD